MAVTVCTHFGIMSAFCGAGASPGNQRSSSVPSRGPPPAQRGGFDAAADASPNPPGLGGLKRTSNTAVQ
eukprot:3738181-Amphidinium_carterae.1